MENEKFLVPIIVRLAIFIAIPVFHWWFHHLVEHGIASVEKLEAFERITKRFRFLPDLLLIGALIGLHFVME
jgi:hypothetical protein